MPDAASLSPVQVSCIIDLADGRMIWWPKKDVKNILHA